MGADVVKRSRGSTLLSCIDVLFDAVGRRSMEHSCVKVVHTSRRPVQMQVSADERTLLGAVRHRSQPPAAVGDNPICSPADYWFGEQHRTDPAAQPEFTVTALPATTSDSC